MDNFYASLLLFEIAQDCADWHSQISKHILNTMFLGCFLSAETTFIAAVNAFSKVPFPRTQHSKYVLSIIIRHIVAHWRACA